MPLCNVLHGKAAPQKSSHFSLASPETGLVT